MMLFATMVLGKMSEMLAAGNTSWYANTLHFLNAEMGYGRFLYVLLELVMIYFFAYFWTTVQFQPKEMANQLRDYGSFIPGLRPGKRTADYLERLMMRMTYVGAAFLCIIAVIPTAISAWMKIPFQITA